MRVAIAIHGGNNVDFGVYVNHLSLMAIASQNKQGYQVALASTKGVRILHARNELAKHVLKMDCDYVFFLDTDHIVPLDIIDRLLMNMKNVDVVSGLICRRRDNMDHVGYNVVGEKYAKLNFLYEEGGGLCFVDVCAFGCTLIKTDVLKAMGDPCFRNDLNKNGKDVTRSDICFCLDARKLGFKVGIDTRVLVGHMGEPVVVWPKTSKELSTLAKSGVLGFTHP